MFSVKKEYTLDSVADFDAWSGGRQWLDTFIRIGDRAIEPLDSFLDEMSYCYNEQGDGLTDSQINDFLWFDAWDYLEENGFVTEEDL